MSKNSKEVHNALYQLASETEGFFTREEAKNIGFTKDMLYYHLRKGHIERHTSEIYRLTQYPRGQNMDFIRIWLWSKKEGVFSHQTALVLHELHPIFSFCPHLTIPGSPLRYEDVHPSFLSHGGVPIYHYSNIPEIEKCWYGPFKITTVARTLRDYIFSHSASDNPHHAIQKAKARGLLNPEELKEIEILYEKTNNKRD